MFTVRLRHKDKIAKCRLFLVPGDAPVLQGMPDIELLDILKIICEVMRDQHKSRMLDSQKIQASSGPSFKTNKVQQTKIDQVDVNDSNSNILDYFRFSINRTADRRAIQVLINKKSGFSDSFQELDVVEAHLVYRSRTTADHISCAPGR